MEMTAVYEMLMVNMATGYGGNLYAFKTSDMVYEEGMQPGVCLLFDEEMNLRDIVASYGDILADSMIAVDAIHEYYAMLYDEELPMSEDEIETVYCGLQNGLLNLILLSESTDILITTTNN